MELSQALEIVNGQLPRLAFLGKDLKEAATLVALAASTYEKATWTYYYRYVSPTEQGAWVPGFPSLTHAQENGFTVEQIRGRGDEAVQTGTWSPLENAQLPPLAKPGV